MINKISKKFNYWKRVFSAYVLGGTSQLDFWHGKPKINKKISYKELGQYYMLFSYKANYSGFFDRNGVPLLDYHGEIGKQYNPISISQYGLAHFNIYKKTKNQENLTKSIKQADWLVNNLKKNKKGVWVWMHNFDWEYRERLKSPWYSALAQGSGISLLVRIYNKTKQEKYLKTAKKAFLSLKVSIKNGGVLYKDKNNNYWLEEYLVNPPTHVLNGFIWTIFGVYDYWLLTQSKEAKELFDNCILTLKENLHKYDIDFWSLYEQSGTKLKMITSPFYHRLHIVQLKILYGLTKEDVFKKYYLKWKKYQNNFLKKSFALIYKIIFKIFYY